MISDAAVEGLAGSLGAVAAVVLTYPLLTVCALSSACASRENQRWCANCGEPPLFVPWPHARVHALDFCRADQHAAVSRAGSGQGRKAAVFGNTSAAGTPSYSSSLASALRLQQAETVAVKPGPAIRGSLEVQLELVQILKDSGPGGFYHGLKPALLGTVASQGVPMSL